MIDLEAVLDRVTAHMEAGVASPGNDIPDVTSVTKGDYATPTAKKVQITVDWAGSNFSGGVAGAMLTEDADIAIRGYLVDIPNDDVVNAAARALRTQIILWMQKYKGNILQLRSARYILPAEKPDFRFTIGAEVRYTTKNFG